VDNGLDATAALSPYAFWAAGFTNATGAYQTLTEQYCALRFSVTGPAPPTYVGAPFSLTVTAQNPNLTTASGYRGTVHFTSSDPNAALPTDYTFTAGDAGTHVFNGVVFNSTGSLTITASDTATPFASGTAAFTVTCLGACPGPGGTSGSRDASQGSGGTAGTRDANQAGGVNPGPRLPRLGAMERGDAPSGVALATALGPAPAAVGAASAPVSTVVEAPSVSAAVPAAARGAASPDSEILAVPIAYGDAMMAASNAPAVKVENNPGDLPLVFIPLTVISIVLLEIRRRNRRLIGHSRP
jgi:hypothetical protein